jgi:hypothetical protein
MKRDMNKTEGSHTPFIIPSLMENTVGVGGGGNILLQTGRRLNEDLEA